MNSIDMREMVDGPSWDSRQVQSVDMNPIYGSGSLSEVKSFQSGISVVTQNFLLHGNEEIRLTREDAGPPTLAFFTWFSGIDHIAYEKIRVPLGDRFSNIYFPEYKPVRFMQVKCNTPIRTIMVCMDAAIFAELTGRSREELIESLEILDWRGGKRNKIARLKSLEFAQKMCGYQAFESFINHPHDTLFLEAKALELVALQLRQLDHLTGKSNHGRAVGRHVEMITRACEILKTEMAEPPGARELARRVGLNHNQLVQGFREMFGIGPFEYLRTIRLEKARDLIASHECNVTEAAFKVGYASLSHFSRAFRESFGANPKALAKEKKWFKQSKNTTVKR